jgi:hypothetical protein
MTHRALRTVPTSDLVRGQSAVIAHRVRSWLRLG